MVSNAVIEHYNEQLGAVFAGRRVVVVGGPVAGLRDLAARLRQLGAERPFILGSSIGTGALPQEEEAEWCSLEVTATTATDAIRKYESLLVHLPDDARERLDEFDPDRRAVAVGTMLLGDVREVAGRPRYGARPRSWMALEDKTRIDELWDSIGVMRAPSMIVRPDFDALMAATSEMDRGAGAVWACDIREGINGGADGLRWVRDEATGREALEYLDTRAERVRVMPFLEGIPCGIHGMVFSDGVAVFRPVEQMTLRRDSGSRLVFAGVATYWDPPAQARESMRELARRTGFALAERVGFRGAFCIDGVLTESGFLPTELNPRIAAGLGVLAEAIPSLPLPLLALAAQAGEELDFRPAELEDLVVEATDAHRAGGGWLVVPKRRSHTERRALVMENGGYRAALSGETADGYLEIGPSDVGGFVRFAPKGHGVPLGEPFAPRLVQALAAADQELGAGVGPLHPARP